MFRDSDMSCIILIEVILVLLQGHIVWDYKICWNIKSNHSNRGEFATLRITDSN